MLTWNYPREFWLRVTNSVLGTILLLLLAVVVFGFVLDVIRRLRKGRGQDSSDAIPSNIADVGTTLTDGGRRLDQDDHPHPGNS